MKMPEYLTKRRLLYLAILIFLVGFAFLFCGRAKAADCPCPEEKPKPKPPVVRNIAKPKSVPHGTWFVPLTAGYLRGPFAAAGVGYQFRSNHVSVAGQAVYGRINGLSGDASCFIGCRECQASFQGASQHELGAAFTVTIPIK